MEAVMKMLKKVWKATVFNGSAGLMRGLVLSMFFVSLLLLNSCANLIESARKGDTAGVKALIDKGADVNAKNKDGDTALMSASLKGHTEIVKALIEKGADVNAKDKAGWTALMSASFYGYIEIVRALLNKGADVNAKSENGYTALMYASQYGRIEIVNALLNKGANVNAKNKDGKTALMWASEKGHTEVVKVLRQEEEKKKLIADFKKAQDTNTIMAYEDFLKQHPNSTFANEVALSLEKLYFDKALSENTVTGYKKFIEKYPKGKLSDEVKIKIEKLELLHKQRVAEWKKKSCAEVIDEWATNDPDEIAVSINMNRDDVSKLRGTRPGRTVLAPDGCTTLIEGERVTLYCDGQPLTRNSCYLPCPTVAGGANPISSKENKTNVIVSQLLTEDGLLSFYQKQKGNLQKLLSENGLVSTDTMPGAKITGEGEGNFFVKNGINLYLIDDKKQGGRTITLTDKGGLDYAHVKMLNCPRTIPLQALIYAVEKGDRASVKALLDKGADVNTKDKSGFSGYTALMLASQKGHTEIVKALLDKGADVNAKDMYGNTALMQASFYGHTEIVKALIDKGADVNAKDKYGETALMWASKKGYAEIVQMLKKAGAKE
jgi:serine/threonine-protein phosphatase 6 regulatory ankyrin repeat subunit B